MQELLALEPGLIEEDGSAIHIRPKHGGSRGSGYDTALPACAGPDQAESHPGI